MTQPILLNSGWKNTSTYCHSMCTSTVVLHWSRMLIVSLLWSHLSLFSQCLNIVGVTYGHETNPLNLRSVVENTTPYNQEQYMRIVTALICTRRKTKKVLIHVNSTPRGNYIKTKLHTHTHTHGCGFNHFGVVFKLCFRHQNQGLIVDTTRVHVGWWWWRKCSTVWWS